jgi:CBS domain-containing protein
VHSVNAVPRDEWAVTSVQAAMLPREKVHTTHPDMPVLLILEKMQNEDINQMPVVAAIDGVERVVGLVTREAILRMLQTRMEVGALAEQ